ncbi:MAG: hypothetical protein H6R13_3307 [Proteobacteria bacterium]|nr:hypothetical protein [Pseudomonadota bacterium]
MVRLASHNEWLNMNITILCSDPGHPVSPRLQAWASRWNGHRVAIVQRAAEAKGGDLLFLVSCHEIIREDTRRCYRHVLVMHAADLPADRGWSPHVWAVLRGDGALTVSLLEAADGVDSGRIFRKLRIPLRGTEVCAEINDKLFDAELQLMDWAMVNIDSAVPDVQDESRASYLRRRTAEDSRLDPMQTIAAQFDLLRVADADRYPAFVEYRGRKYAFRMTPMEPLEDGESANE